MRNAGITFKFALLLLLLLSADASAAERGGILVASSIDGSEQPSYLILPDGYRRAGAPRPLLVSLHTWSGDHQQRNELLEQAANAEGWIYLFPNFRGANNRPEACGSNLAQQDILDAVAWVCRYHAVDERRIYLAGTSGGGHMTMLMAAKHPEVWAAASAFVGISDLAAWHDRHRDAKYGKMLRAVCGGAAGSSAEVDAQYRARSPIHFLKNAVDVPIDLAAGIHDGHRGSVPIRHTLDAFNAIAAAGSHPVISPGEIAQLSRRDGRLDAPQPQDTADDASFGRAIYLRRHAGKARVTIFEGGHEGIASAMIEWLKQHQKKRER